MTNNKTQTAASSSSSIQMPKLSLRMSNGGNCANESNTNTTAIHDYRNSNNVYVQLHNPKAYLHNDLINRTDQQTTKHKSSHNNSSKSLSTMSPIFKLNQNGLHHSTSPPSPPPQRITIPMNHESISFDNVIDNDEDDDEMYQDAIADQQYQQHDEQSDDSTKMWTTRSGNVATSNTTSTASTTPTEHYQDNIAGNERRLRHDNDQLLSETNGDESEQDDFVQTLESRDKFDHIDNCRNCPKNQSSDSLDDSTLVLNCRRKRFSVRTLSEGVDPTPLPPINLVVHPVPPSYCSSLVNSYRTDSLATIANYPTSTTSTSHHEPSSSQVLSSSRPLNTATTQPNNTRTTSPSQHSSQHSISNITSNNSSVSSLPSQLLLLQTAKQQHHKPLRIALANNNNNNNNRNSPVNRFTNSSIFQAGDGPSSATSTITSVNSGKPPIRPSILKSSPFVANGGHRRSCPKSYTARQRNMSGDIASTTTSVANGSLSSMPSGFISNSGNKDHRRRLLSHYSEDDTSEERFFDASTDLIDSSQECTCQQSSVHNNPSKSVHILTPTKSEEILFDPAKSVASSIISINKVPQSKKKQITSRVNYEGGNLNYQPGHQLQPQQSTRTFKSNDHGRVDLPVSSNIRTHQTSPEPPSDDLRMNEDNSLTPLINYRQHDHQCDQRHPQSGSSNSSDLNGSQLTDVSYFDDYDDPPYKDTVVSMYEPISTDPAKEKMAFQCDGPGYMALPDSNDGRFDSCDDSGQGDGEEYDEYDDNPHYCSKCNIWFGVSDASYPFKCNCYGQDGKAGTGGTGGGTDTLNTNDTQSVYSISSMDKDFRYFLQHPYSRLFVAYFVVFCNFLIFAEDPLSHSLRECSIPVLGNVISFLFTKYPHEPEWQLFKGVLGLVAIILGLICGKYFFHHFLLRRMFRLKMFRDESGTWMIMLISTVIICYVFSKVYNMSLRVFHPEASLYLINSRMGMSYASFMKVAACGTWLGDFFTAWMITDMMLQDNLYPQWAPRLRSFWHRHTTVRIMIFWSGALVIATIVITIILTDWICWDNLSEDFVSTSELSRAFLASAILFMDLLIVMQDWDFPHFVCDLNIKLPGLLRPSYTFNFCRKSLKFSEIEVKVSGKWFNYGIIVFVMMLDLNMWKNQIIYYPADFGQYIHPGTNKIYTVNETAPATVDLMDPELSNYTVWNYELRAASIDPSTNRSLVESDLVIQSKYFGYPALVKGLAFIPIAFGFTCFFYLIYLYGRFPPKTDKSLGGRLKRRPRMHKSSWRRERRDSRGKVSWHGITVYSDPNRISRLNNPNGTDLTDTCRPTYVITNDNLPAPSQLAPNEQHFVSSIMVDPISQYSQPYYPQPNESSLEHNQSMANQANQSNTSNVFAPYLRLMPQFNGQLIWSSLISVLNLKNRDSMGQPINGLTVQSFSASPDQQQEWVPLQSNNNSNMHQQATMTSPAGAATIVTLPPFHPGTMLQFQTQIVQLPVQTAS